MNHVLQHFSASFLPLFLAAAAVPSLRKHPKSISILVGLAVVYFVLWFTDSFGNHWPPVAIAIGSFAFLLGALVFALRSLVLRQMSHRIVEIVVSLALLVTAASLTTLGDEGYLLNAAVGLLIGTGAVVLGLIFDIEDQREKILDDETSGGFHFLFPRHSSLILISILLFGSVPGSLLFLIEDILLHDLSEISAMLVVLTLLITAITSVSSYRVYTKVFVGRTDFVLPSHLRRDPSRWVGLLILFFILLGLNPWMFLGGH